MIRVQPQQAPSSPLKRKLSARKKKLAAAQPLPMKDLESLTDLSSVLRSAVALNQEPAGERLCPSLGLSLIRSSAWSGTQISGAIPTVIPENSGRVTPMTVNGV